MTYVTFALLGLGSGGVYAAMGITLVLLYRSSGAVNFAAGAIAMYVAYTFALLRENGDLFNPIFGLPTRIHIADHISTAVALVLALVIAGILGLLTYLCIFRFLRTALPISRVVASVGLLVLVQTVVTARLGTSPVSVDNLLPSTVWKVGDLKLPEDRILLAATMVVIAAVLAAVMRFTRFGVMTRAVAESEKGAVLVGISTNKVAAINWALGAMVAGLSGILISPIVPVVPSSYTLLIVPGLAAALVGRFAAFGPTVATGLAIGVFQSIAAELSASYGWFPKSGVSDAFVFVLIIAILIIRGERLPSRGALIQQQLPRTAVPQHVAAWAVGSALVLGALLTTINGQYRTAIIVSLIISTLSLSWVVVTGYAGQVSLVQLTLAGVAGFILSRLTTQWGVPFPLSLLIAGLAAAAAGVIVGIPALRVRGVNLAIVTMTAAVAITSLYFTNPQINGGVQGGQVLGPSLAGLNLGIGGGTDYPRAQFGYLVAVLLCITGAGVANLRRSRLGSQMLAVRANERAAAAGGINVALIKLAAFAIGAFIAGISGALLGFQGGFVSSDNFDIFIGLTLFAFAYLAGISSIAGAIVAGVVTSGGIFIVVLSNWVSSTTYVPIVGAILLIMTAITNPGGYVPPTQVQLNALVGKLVDGRRLAR